MAATCAALTKENLTLGMQFTFTLSTIHETAARLLDLTGKDKVFALHGEMGTGKTTFVYALCEKLGVVDAVSSPTFPIINEYETEAGETVFHIDLYRLGGPQEAVQAGVEETILSGNTCFVEWPERAPSLFPPATIHLYFQLVNDSTRRLTIGD